MGQEKRQVRCEQTSQCPNESCSFVASLVLPFEAVHSVSRLEHLLRLGVIKK